MIYYILYIILYILLYMYYILYYLFINILIRTCTCACTRVALNKEHPAKLTCEALAELVIAFKRIIRGLEGLNGCLGIPR